MVTSFLVLLGLINIIHGAVTYPPYQVLDGLVLPYFMSRTNVAYHEATKSLYLFGGKNYTLGFAAVPNVRWFKLDLSGVTWTYDSTNDQLDSGTVAELNALIWTPISVTPPSFGPSGDDSDLWSTTHTYSGTTDPGQFICEGQCTAVIGDYLYIIGTKTENNIIAIDSATIMYRVDLSSGTPTFSAPGVYDYDISGQGLGQTPCVTTDGTALYYMSGLFSPSVWSTSFYRYNVGGSHEALADLNEGRYRATCTWNLDNTALYIFAGTGDQTSSKGAVASDFYSTANGWSHFLVDHIDYQFGFRPSDIPEQTDLSEHLLGVQAQTSHFEQMVEIISGFVNGGTEVATSDMFNTHDNVLDRTATNTVALATSFYGRVEIPVAVPYSTGDGLYVEFLFGGDSDLDSLNATQYAVRYGAFTSAPTTSMPTTSPSLNPSAYPSVTPTQSPLPEGVTNEPTSLAPSQSPLPAGVTHSPTVSPIPQEVTEDEGDDVSMITKMIAIFISIVVTVFV